MSILSFFVRKPKPIGYAEWGNVRAELWGVNVWRAWRGGKPDAELVRRLATIYEDREVYRGPSDGFYGFAVLRDLADQMGGTFKFNAPKSSGRDVAY
jgi:hypothetical protein